MEKEAGVVMSVAGEGKGGEREGFIERDNVVELFMMIAIA